MYGVCLQQFCKHVYTLWNKQIAIEFSMKFIGKNNYDHSSAERIGLLITNLGTPSAATPYALRKYFAEFLWDPRVVEYPRILWWLILHLVILRIRPRIKAKSYAKIWTKQGSPLMVYTEAQLQALKDVFHSQYDLGHIEIDFAMRYGQPSIESALLNMEQKGVTNLLVLPLYPQYSGSTAGSTFDAVAATLSKLRWMPELRFINQYADDEGYITACTSRIKKYWQQHQRNEKLLFSFHGLPKRFLLAGDPYHCQCYKTARLIAEELQLNKNDWRLTFQSRFGKEEWLQPYTDETLKALASEGVKSVDVFCPGFSADCIETLEEMDMENREIFMTAGGQHFQYIPALNDSVEHINAISKIALKHMQGWLQANSDFDYDAHIKEKKITQQRAKELGAAK